MKKEIWTPILGYEELYWVSNWGRIKSINYNKTGKEKILRPSKNRDGYFKVCLCRDGKPKYFRVHRLVWEAFYGPIPKGMQVNHINEDKTDNHLENLNLMTCKENNNWGTRNERAGKGIAKSRCKMVEQYTLNGVHFMTWFSAKGAVEVLGQLGYDTAAISRCCQGKQKTHKGYIWKYAKKEAV